MSTICKLKFNENLEVFEFNKIAKQSNGSVLFKQGNAVLLASVVSEMDNPVDEDFTPLTVQYIEKTYASAKFNGGFIKREGKPSDFEILTSRIIDRSLRPLFPQGYVYPTTITVMVLSADKELDLQVLALNAANAALYTSNLPIKKSIAGVRIGKINNELIINPTKTDMQKSTLDLFVAGSKSELLMIEMKSICSEEIVKVDTEVFVKKHRTNDISEVNLIDAIKLSLNTLNTLNIAYENSFEIASKDMVEVNLITSNIETNTIKYVRDYYTNDINNAIKKLAKSERSNSLKNIAKQILMDDFSINQKLEYNNLYEAVNIIKKELVREMILDKNIRADGRGLTDIRPISIDINILPSAHSSCLFTRGETQALVITTLGGSKDGQMYEVLSEKSSRTENFMLHYNFPGFSVGEAKPIFGVSRRELGHGNLAKTALEPSINIEFIDTIRLVSEILESNGSSSMATVCGGSLALKAAGVPISNLIAGIAMGAIFDNSNVTSKYAILTDITGLEDHDGDMDFKVAGTKNGITALQMDIKLGGIDLDILTNALLQAKDGRNHILSLMEKASLNIVLSDALPIITQFKIDPSKIISVIGKAGSVIKEIIEKFKVDIDLDRDTGGVKVSGANKQNVNDAILYIRNISSNVKSFVKKETINFEKIYTINEILDGKIVRLVDFGAFIELPKGGEGLLHISKISKKRVSNIHDVLKINQNINIKVLNLSKDRIELASANLD
jgi:polyribonucleotide nucleotidyltransferase